MSLGGRAHQTSNAFDVSKTDLRGSKHDIVLCGYLRSWQRLLHNAVRPPCLENFPQFRTSSSCIPYHQVYHGHSYDRECKASWLACPFIFGTRNEALSLHCLRKALAQHFTGLEFLELQLDYSGPLVFNNEYIHPKLDDDQVVDELHQIRSKLS
jgi:hypothetical protein